MRWIAGLLLLVLLSGSAFAVTVGDHPRLLFDGDDAAVYKTRLQGLTPWWSNGVATGWSHQCESYRTNPQNAYFLMSLAAYAYVMQEGNATPNAITADAIRHLRVYLRTAYGQAAIRSGNTVARIDPYTACYDWLYPWLPTSTKDSLETKMLAHVNAAKSQANWSAGYTQPLVFTDAIVAHGEMTAAADNDTLDAVLGRTIRYFDQWMFPCWDAIGTYGPGPIFYPGLYVALDLVMFDSILRCTDQGAVVTSRAAGFAEWSKFWRHQVVPPGVMRLSVNRYNSDTWRVPVVNGLFGFRLHEDAMQRWILGDFYSQGGMNSNYSDPGHYAFAALYDPALVPSSQAAATRFDSPGLATFYRSGWNERSTSTDIWYGFYAGHSVTPDVESSRGQLHVQVGRGQDDLLFNSNKFYDSSDQFWNRGGRRTLAHNSICVYDPSETDANGVVIYDGGQDSVLTGTVPSLVPCQAGPLEGSVAQRAVYDSLETASAQVWGAICDATTDYADAKVDNVTRRVRSPVADWLIVQDYIDVNGPLATSVVWHMIGRPTADGTHTQVTGTAAGGIWSSTDATYAKVTQGNSACVLYPRYSGGQSMTMRTIGGASAAGLVWRQTVATPPTLTYVANPADQAYECYVEPLSRNRSPTHASLTQAQIDGRNSHPAPVGDWRLEWRIASAANVQRIVTLIQTGASNLTPLAVTASSPDHFKILSVPAAALVFIEALIYDSPDVMQPLWDNVSFTVTAAGTTVYGNGLADGDYDLLKSEVDVGNVTVTGSTYKITGLSPGDYTITQDSGTSTGSCCYSDGSCAVTTNLGCVGDWTLDGVCEPNTCAQPTGACCAEAGTCTVTESASCASPSVWLGAGTVCDPNSCPQPATGACCALDGTCSETTAILCAAAGGVHQGDGTDCAPNPCPQPDVTGACCYPNGTCAVVTVETCTAASGWWGGLDAVCDLEVCGALGACCRADGVCFFTRAEFCAYEFNAGYWCQPNPCATLQGACCAADASCAIRTPGGCVGTYRGPATVCDPNPCIGGTSGVPDVVVPGDSPGGSGGEKGGWWSFFFGR